MGNAVTSLAFCDAVAAAIQTSSQSNASAKKWGSSMESVSR
jgi:hypothetical protein